MIRSNSVRLAAQGRNLLRCAGATNSNSKSSIPTSNAKSISTDNHQQNNATAEPSRVSESDKFLHYSADEGYYKTSPYEPTPKLNMPVHEYVWQDVKKWQDLVASVCVVTGRQYTFAKLRDASAALAIRLQTKFKLVQNDVIAVCLPNVPEYPIAALGAIEAGLTVTTLNPIYTPEEISRQLSFSNAKFLIGTCANYSTLQKACQLTQKQLPIACIRTQRSETVPAGAIDFFELISSGSVDFGSLQQCDVNGEEIAFLPFSSGTTGLPKGVQLTHNNITVNCEQVIGPIHDDSTVFQDTLPCVLPFFHIYGLTMVMLSKLRQGARLATMPQFKTEDLLRSLHEYKGSMLNLVPPIALFMIHHPKLSQETAPNLRMIISGAAPISNSDVGRLLKKFPKVRFVQGFGMTESSPLVLLTPEGNTRYASVGFLTGSTEGKIVSFDSDSDFKGLGPNISGELCVRGPQVMRGYLNNEEANKEAFLPGRWLRTGDIAHYDEDGYFYITDRLKELIKVKGFQVPPAELEAVLRNHPKVLEAAVFGIQHEFSGEVPRAVVVLKPDTESSQDEICSYVAEHVAHYKRLEGGVIFAAEIPKNPTGKILRRQIKEKYSS